METLSETQHFAFFTFCLANPKRNRKLRLFVCHPLQNCYSKCSSSMGEGRETESLRRTGFSSYTPHIRTFKHTLEGKKRLERERKQNKREKGKKKKRKILSCTDKKLFFLAYFSFFV